MFEGRVGECPPLVGGRGPEQDLGGCGICKCCECRWVDNWVSGEVVKRIGLSPFVGASVVGAPERERSRAPEAEEESLLGGTLWGEPTNFWTSPRSGVSRGRRAE